MRWLACHVLGVSRTDLPMARYIALRQRMAALGRTDRLGSALDMVPSVAAIVCIPIWVSAARHFPIAWRFAFEATFAVCIVVYIGWLLRRRYTRHGWQALRDLGYADVCARCGYDLSRQPHAEGRCSECGASFTRFRPAQTDATVRR